MSVPPDGPPELPRAPRRSSGARKRVPETIGHYRILAALGEGGMGTVYEAEQDNPHRKVALKVVRPDLVSPMLVKRFNRESEALGRLEHPGIARIYEAGTAEGPHGPQPFFAMELVKGEPLDSYAKSMKLTVSQRLALFIRICEGVHYAHQKGVIHRDLKPTNILVDASGQPKILDFGVARLNDTEVPMTRATTMGQMIGTLQYMSPEQVNADPDDLDIRSDVYSLGVILYELLSERLPYDISKDLLHQAAWTILQVDPAPLSSVDRDLRGDVETIVNKALEKEKDRRYSSADDLASDIRRFLNHEPITARPISTWYQLRKFADRNKALVAGLALAGLILVIGTVLSTWLAVRATAAERLAESRRTEAVSAQQLAEQRRAETAAALVATDSARAEALQEKALATASARRASQEAEKARSVNSFLQDMLSSADPSRARGKEVTVREVLDRASTGGYGENLRRQPEVRASVDATIGQTYYALGLYDQARPYLDSAYAVRRRLNPSSVDFTKSAADQAELARASGDFRLAEQRLKEAIAIDRRQLDPTDDRLTSKLTALAIVVYNLGKMDEAEQLHREALALTRKRHGNSGIEVASQLQAYGQFLLYTLRAPKAESLLVQAMAMTRAGYEADHPRIVNTLVALADAQEAQSKLPESDSTLVEALTLAHKIYGPEHPTVADILARRGNVLAGMRRLEEGEKLIREAIGVRLKLLGEQHPDVQLARVDLARLLLWQQRYGEADTLLTLALAGRRAAVGDSNPAIASTLQDLGYSAEQQGRWVDAEKYYREAITIWRYGSYPRDEAATMAQLGWVLSQQKRLNEADSLLQLVLLSYRKEYGDQSRQAGDTYEKMANIAVQQENFPRAESLTVAGLDIRNQVWGPESPQAADQMMNLAFMREKLGDTIAAIPLIRKSIDNYRAVRPPSDPTLLRYQQWLGEDLCITGRTAEGEALVRTTMELIPADSNRSLPWRIRGSLGECLLRQKKFAEAEPPLLEAEQRMKSVPNVPPLLVKRTVTRLVDLYRQWGKQDLETIWAAKQ